MLNSSEIKRLIKNQDKKSLNRVSIKGLVSKNGDRIVMLKGKINDENYIDVAIKKMASDIAQNFF